MYFKFVLFFCGGICILLLVLNYELVSYLAVQGCGQLKILAGARPVGKFLVREDIPDENKQKLLLISELKRFAVNNLGLRDNGCYSTYYHSNEPVRVWLVIATGEFSLEPYKWKFPVVGEFSYKGYFDRKTADRVAAELAVRGYETRVRPASAWSTLGYFKDPVLSSMLERSEGDLADLIFHEMTHGTVFVKNDLQFNENLASFIGEKGALFYLREKYGENSVQLSAYIDEQYDYNLFYDHIVSGAKRLDTLYKGFDNTLSVEEKRRQKNRLVDRIVSEIFTLPLRDSARFEKYRGFKPNNAYFSSYMTYRSDLSSFENDYASQGNDLRRYVSWIKERYKDKNMIKAD